MARLSSDAKNSMSRVIVTRVLPVMAVVTYLSTYLTHSTADSPGRKLLQEGGGACDAAPWVVEMENFHGIGIIAEVIILFYAFLGMGVVADDYFGNAMETLVERLEISEDVAGASFMAFGNAAPEIFLNLVTTCLGTQGANDLGASSVIGSSMFSFLCVNGATCLFAYKALSLTAFSLTRDVIAYSVALVLLVLTVGRGQVFLWEGALMLFTYAVYLVFIKFSSSIQESLETCLNSTGKSGAINNEPDSAVNLNSDSNTGLLAGSGYQVYDNSKVGEADEAGTANNYSSTVDEAEKGASDVDSIDVEEEEEEEGLGGQIFEALKAPLDALYGMTCPDCSLGSEGEKYYMLTFVIAMAYIGVYSYIIVTIIERMVCLLGASNSVFGLTLCAIGANISDIVSSVSVARKGFGDMAFSNAIGSQSVNILFGLGLPWMMSNMLGQPIFVNAADLQIACVAVGGCVIFFMTTVIVFKFHVNKLTGVVFLLGYVSCVAFTVVATKEHWHLITLPSF